MKNSIYFIKTCIGVLVFVNSFFTNAQSTPINVVLPINGGVLESFTAEYGSGYVATDLTNGISNEDGWASPDTPIGPYEFVYSFSGGQNATLVDAVISGGLAEGLYYSKNVEVWTSADGTNFTLAASGTLANSSNSEITLDLGSTIAKKIKLVITSGYSIVNWELAEFTVNGVVWSGVDNDSDGVDDNIDLDDDNDGILDEEEGMYSVYIPLSVLQLPNHITNADVALLFDGSSAYTGNQNLRIHSFITSSNLNTAILTNALVMGTVGSQEFPAGTSYTLSLENDDVLNDNATTIANTLVADLTTLGLDPEDLFNSNFKDRFDTNPAIGVDGLDATDFDLNGNNIIDAGDFSPMGAILQFYDADPSAGGNILKTSYSEIKLFNPSGVQQHTVIADDPFTHFVIASLPDGTGKDIRVNEIQINGVVNTGFVGGVIGVTTYFSPDTDGDGIQNHLDLDSDNDGCPDALEGDAPTSQIGFTELDIDDSIAGSVDSNGVPVIANGGQELGTSLNNNALSEECLCDPLNPSFVDVDDDNVGDVCDLDDDNDGIPDCIEKGLLNTQFSDLFSLGLNNVSQISNTEIQLTPDVSTQSGSAFSNDKIYFGQNFSFSFEIYLGTTDIGGADGIAIVFHNDPAGTAAIGNVGGGLGASGISNGIVLEFDTYQNVPVGDIVNDHTAIWDSDNPGIGPLSTTVDFGNLEDGAWHSVVISWNASTQTINYTLDGAIAGSFTNDLVSNYFGGSDLVHFGFTASTGSDTNDQRVRFPDGFCNFPLFVDTDGDGLENYLDIDSDNDGIPDNIEAQSTLGYIPPSNMGTSIVDNNDNGLDDVYESAMGGTDILVLEDTDGDNIEDYLDIDSDNDGYDDIAENGMSDSYTAADVDGDGLVNSFEINGVNDATADINEDIEDPTDLSVLPDADTDLMTGGDLDYRDMFDVNPTPIASIDFDGVDDYLSRASFINGLNNVTIMAWVKSDSGNASDMVIAGEDSGFRLWLDNGNKPMFTVKTAGNAETEIGCSCANINFDEWHHITGVYSSSGDMTLYVDGALADSGNVGSANAVIENTTDSNGNFEVGRLSTNDVPNNQYFKGDIDEVRVFDIALTAGQIQQIVYQEVEDNSGNVIGKVVPKSMSTNVPWESLIAYYPMTDIVTGTTTDYSSYDNKLYLNYITTIQSQTAPMPYLSTGNSSWTTESTWAHGDVWDIEDTGSNKDWSIIKISSDVSACHSIKASSLIIDSGQSLRVHSDNLVENSWYLELNGTLDLEDDSQLIQTINSDLVTSANGKILRRQEGESNPYRYNYWGSPIGLTGVTPLTDNNASTNNANNAAFNLGMIKDDSGSSCNFTSGYTGNGSISTYWLYTFINGLTYWDWGHLGTSTPLNPGVGYTQKGTGVADPQQQYIFEGKPNNGTILIDVEDVGGPGSVVDVSKTEYLLGNPYPSALDVHQFIDDNAGIIKGDLQLWQQWGGNSHNLNEYHGGYAQLNKTGSTRAYQFVGFSDGNNGSQDGTKTPSKYLPVGQGFMAEIIADGQVEFNNGQRIFIKEADADINDPYNTGSTFFKSSKTKKGETAKVDTSKESSEKPDMQKIRLEFNSVTGPKTRRELLLAFSDYTSDDFDYGYDAECTESNNNDLNLNLEGKNMNIQAYSPITDDKVVPLNFKSSGDNTFEIKISESQGIDEDQKVYIKDNLTGDYFDLTQDVAFPFSSEQGKFNTRFEIVFQSEQQALGIEEVLATENHIYYQNKTNTLFVKKLNTQVSKLSLVNMRGQVSLEMNNVPMAALENGMKFFNMSAGAYVVQLRTEDNEVITKKIIVN